MAIFLDLKGTTVDNLQLGKGGPKFQNTAGDIHFHAPNLVDYVDLFANVLRATGNELVLNTNASNTGSNRKYTIKRPTTGMSAALTLHLPPNYGSAGQFLQSDGAGNTSWATGGGGTVSYEVYRTFGASGTMSVASNISLPLLIQGSGTILGARAYLRTAPTGGSVTYDLKKNGVSIFSVLPTFAAGQNLATAGTISSAGVLANDVFELDITAASQTSGGDDITVVLTITESAANANAYRGFGVQGYVVNGTNAALPLLVTATGTITSVKGYLRTAGTTCDFDVKKNGVSIFSTTPSFAATQFSSGEVLSTTAIAANDVLELDISNVTGTPQDLTVVIKVQE